MDLALAHCRVSPTHIIDKTSWQPANVSGCKLTHSPRHGVAGSLTVTGA